MQNPDIVIHEVGLRDGLQIERSIVPTATKVAWARRLAESGLDMIQLGSFVHREKVPQMADTDELFGLLHDLGPRPVLTGLVLNEKGLERGLAAGVHVLLPRRVGERHAQPQEHRDEHGRRSGAHRQSGRDRPGGRRVRAGVRAVGLRLRLRGRGARESRARHRVALPRRGPAGGEPGGHGGPRDAGSCRAALHRRPAARSHRGVCLSLPRHLRSRARELSRGAGARA